ncbi:MAG TPA: hypothetical protein VMD52_00470 [Patescibacteria group bacterium]|nr:hypothetical protein [Patescibacteria group bacterium]
MAHLVKKILSCFICRKIFSYVMLCLWELTGRKMAPPNIIKRRVVKKYGKLFSLKVFIETGTLFGDTVDAVKNMFDRIFSIELDEELYEKAKKRFEKFGHISILQGDSGKVLPELLPTISEPCLFWLDGHYSSWGTAKGQLEAPIIMELTCILNHPVKNHVILIDDARLYIGKGDWPDIKEFKAKILDKYPDFVFEVEGDIIRIHHRR